MKINIAVEKENAYFRFDKPRINFPFVFAFLDKMSGTLIEVSLDLDTFKDLFNDICNKVNAEKLIE